MTKSGGMESEQRGQDWERRVRVESAGKGRGKRRRDREGGGSGAVAVQSGAGVGEWLPVMYSQHEGSGTEYRGHWPTQGQIYYNTQLNRVHFDC